MELREFKGQPKLVERVQGLTFDTMPQSLLLMGPRGCGKHTVCSLIAQQLGMSIVELTEKLDDQFIAELYQRAVPTIYLVVANQLSSRAQSSLLKIVEEPVSGAFFIILSESAADILPTLSNRCQQWVFEPYVKELLSSFTDGTQPLVLEIAQTPGQVLEMQQHPLEQMAQLANNIIEKIGTASPSNTLCISDKLAFKSEKDKFEPSLFISVLRHQLVQHIIEDRNPTYPLMYQQLKAYLTKKNLFIVQQKAFDNLLLNLWEAARA